MARFTLKSLLEQYEVHIPQLQRDYAQGRVGQEKIRKPFIQQLYRALDKGEHLNLDFIYGYIKGGVYYPLDGQQRLTTLWLLHWYLAPPEACPEAKAWLKKFGYRTRIIAERFCNALVDSMEQLRGEKVVESLKKTMPWLRHTWKEEPTVAAMLAVLEEIERQFGNKNRAKFWERLTGEVAQAAVTLDSIDMRSEEFRLSDELYIKMNARGKALTPFESYKAHLTEVLRSVKGMCEYNGASISSEAYFSLRADNQWLELFWNPTQRKDIDTPMLNFYRTLARLCFFRQPQEDGRVVERPIADFNDTAVYEVFGKEENTRFLFDTLDLFCHIKQVQGIEAFFAQLFQGIRLFKQEGNPSDKQEGNLFDEACKESPDVRSQILLLFVVEYMRKYNLHECNNALRDFVRVVRNLLARKRVWEKISYNSDVRINRTGLYWQEWSPLLEDAVVYRALSLKAIDVHECHKAALILAHPKCKASLQRLEEHPLLLGITDAFEVKDIDLWAASLPKWLDAFYEIWALAETEEDYRIAQALIACGFNGRFIVGVNSYRSEAWFMGKGSWVIILTAEEYDDEWRKYHIAAPLQVLLSQYLKTQGTPVERLQCIVDAYWKNATTRDWRYYFCKYPEILRDRAAYFAFSNDDPWDVRSLEKLNVRPTRAWHCNPYAYVVGKRLDDESIITYLQGGDNNVAFELLKSVSIRSVKKGWQLGWWEDAPFSKECYIDIFAKYGVDLNEQILRETPERDRIEVAIDFCGELLAKYKSLSKAQNKPQGTV